MLLIASALGFVHGLGADHLMGIVAPDVSLRARKLASRVEQGNDPCYSKGHG
jgi:hypothetical protein